MSRLAATLHVSHWAQNRVPFVILVAVLGCVVAACGDGSGSSTNGPDGNPGGGPTEANATDQDQPKVPVKSAVMGTAVFQREAESIRADVSRIEKQEQPTDAVAVAAQQREIKMVTRNLDHLLTAIAVSIRAESRQILMSRFKHLKTTQSKMLSHLDDLGREVSNIREMLSDAAKGTSEIPPQFTENELKDRAADIAEAMLKVRTEEKELADRLDALQAELRKAVVPEQGETTLTKERDVLQALRKRSEKLLDPS